MKIAKPFRVEEYLDNPEAVASYIVELLLTLPPGQRVDVFSSVRYNDTFCPLCGVGDTENPNTRCQCWNDECCSQESGSKEQLR